MDEVLIEVAVMNIENSMKDVETKNVNQIFMYWSLQEIKFYYELMLQQIDKQKIDN